MSEFLDPPDPAFQFPPNPGFWDLFEPSGDPMNVDPKEPLEAGQQTPAPLLKLKTKPSVKSEESSAGNTPLISSPQQQPAPSSTATPKSSALPTASTANATSRSQRTNTTCTVPNCLKTFTTTSDTRRHEREVHHLHGGVSEYRCKLCPPDSKRGANGDKPFARKWNLQDHVSRVHGGDRGRSKGLGGAAAEESRVTESPKVEVEIEVKEERGVQGKKESRSGAGAGAGRKRKNSEVDSVGGGGGGGGGGNVTTIGTGFTPVGNETSRLKQLEEENQALKGSVKNLVQRLEGGTSASENRELKKLQLQLELAQIENAELREKVKRLEERH